MKLFSVLIPVVFITTVGCSKGSDPEPPPPPPPGVFKVNSWTVDATSSKVTNYGVKRQPSIQINFSAPVDRSTVPTNVQLRNAAGSPVNLDISYAKSDSTLIIRPQQALPHLSRYTGALLGQLKSSQGRVINTPFSLVLVTQIDSSAKFPAISNDSLLTLVQKQTFKYFWDFAHPVSGLARERNNSADVVTSGGSGFGIMSLVVGVHRGFITRQQGIEQMTKIVTFLKEKANTYHGAFPHWLNGITGDSIPFSAKDDGGDLVETSFMVQGLITARQFFNGASPAETNLRNDINTIWQNVEWDWYRKNNENVLYWHWSPKFNWEMNFPIRGWNEALITYVLAASSPTHTIPKEVYTNGWAQNGAIRNNNAYYGVTLPLGPDKGGPLFFSHYSFLGLNPTGLTDQYANYFDQNKAHSLINHHYCVDNPKDFYGYSDSCWGLTASDDINGYMAHEPNNDNSVISPTAALSSFPYTPEESMKALKFFYYVLGDKIWGEYGFYDAFSLHEAWFANSFLAIDQGPIVVMVENYRSGLLWNLFMSAPEIKTGLQKLGFQSPHI